MTTQEEIMSAFKSYFYNGAYTPDELDWPDEMELEEVLSTWGYETEPCLNFGEELKFGVKVYPSTGEWFEQASYLVQLDLGEASELIQVDALPSLLKLLEQVVPLAGASVAPTPATPATSATSSTPSTPPPPPPPPPPSAPSTPPTSSTPSTRSKLKSSTKTTRR